MGEKEGMLNVAAKSIPTIESLVECTMQWGEWQYVPSASLFNST